MEEFRLQYPLTADSLVLDVGVFKGDFIDWCRKKWDCLVIGFEPCKEFFDFAAGRFAGDFRVQLQPYGLSDKNQIASISVNGDATSVHDKRGEIQKIVLRDGARELEPMGVVDLLKVNIEGGEYQLLPRLIETRHMPHVRFLQVQYHSIGHDDPVAARERIRSDLARTHREQWCVNGGQWESWELK